MFLLLAQKIHIRTTKTLSTAFFFMSLLAASLHAALNLWFSIQSVSAPQEKCLLFHSAEPQTLSPALMLHVYECHFTRGHCHICLSKACQCINRLNQTNRHKPCLPYLIEKIYNSNVTIQMISTLFVSLFMCIHKSCFICSLPSLE